MTMTTGRKPGLHALRCAMACATALISTVGLTLPCSASPAPQHLILASQAVVSKRPVSAPRATVAPAARTPQSVVTVSGTAPGQAGYIHYFVITGPDGEPESQVGIELPNDRIAWSFPEMGVVVSPFIRSGQITANGKSFEVEHRYGIRPLRDEQSLRTLQRELADRVAWWVNEKAPYCDEELPPNRLCVSCLGFVLRVLYPGSSPAVPAMPADFKTARRNIYTTEDLLMYLAGVRPDLPREARLKRISALDIPENMREQLVRIATAEATADAQPTNIAKPRTAGRAMKRPAARRGS
jgi:hypothetical protein